MRGQGRNAQVDRAAAEVELDAPVLRQATLGNVEVREDFEAREDGQGEVLGRWWHLIESTVDAVADFELVLKGFEVNVGGLSADGLGEHEVDVTDDGRLPRHLFNVLLAEHRVVADIASLRLEFRRGGVERQHLLAIMLADKQRHTLRIGDGEAHLALQRERQLVDEVGIERIHCEQRD